MTDIRFGTRWAHADFGLIVAPYAVPQPEPQTNYVDIPGRDGALDLTEAFGTVRYLDREIPLTLYARSPFDAAVSSFAAAVHGRRMNVIFDRDPTFYYDTRITIDGVEKEDGYCTLSLSCKAKPYKQKNTVTTVSESVTDTAVITLVNGRMPVVPTITVTAQMTITYTLNRQAYTATLAAGTHTVSSLVLPEGDTEVTVTGTGTITFVYREGAL